MRILFGAVVAASLCIMKVAESDNYVLDDGILMDLPRPAGSCPLSRNHEVDRLYYTQQEDMQAGKNKVITIIVPCRDVTAFRNGAMITEYGMWLLNAPEDKITRIPKSYPRDKVLSDLGKTMPSLDTAKLAADISKKLKRHDINVGLKSFGLIDQDRNAIYLGMLASYSSNNGETSDTAGVIGMTVLQQRVLSFNLYKPFVNKNTYDDLLFQVKQVTANAVGLNTAVESLPKGMEPPHPSVAAGTSSVNWARVADKGIGGGIAGALIGGIAALFGRKRGLDRTLFRVSAWG